MFLFIHECLPFVIMVFLRIDKHTIFAVFFNNANTPVRLSIVERYPHLSIQIIKGLQFSNELPYGFPPRYPFRNLMPDFFLGKPDFAALSRLLHNDESSGKTESE